MVSIRYLFPPTITKVNRNTSTEINKIIQQKAEKTIHDLEDKSNKDIMDRIRQLDYEWDTERVLEINFAVIVLITSKLSLGGHKKWMALSGIASLFMIQHSIQGWCPPLPVIRKFGIRTASEILDEKAILKTMINNSTLK